ncbi:MAG: hypothetical protein JWN68_750 [Nocardioides sp.]|jgi:hypothetical protein|uniref:DUF6924 domain-containing protein n=1 Tax=Nocardioides sp. TaxID=35761 RepID=UPI0026174F94|nr:hypothetical protein [Nocardioides sp.]MCW2832797.1 hypothetical protein [Nocardioides sp.]
MGRTRGEFRAWIVRTHFEDETAWQELIADTGRAGSSAEVVNDLSYRDAPGAVIAPRLGPSGEGVVFVADGEGMRARPHTVLVVDLAGEHPPFRSEASAIAEIEMNLLTDNVGFEDFSTVVRSEGGAFRTISGPAGERGRLENEPRTRRRRPVILRQAVPEKWPKDLIVTMPSAAWSKLEAEQQRLSVPVEQLLHDRVLNHVINDEALKATNYSAVPEEDAVVPVTIQLGMVLHDLVTIGARKGGFTTVQEYCAAALRTVSECL